MNGRCDIASIRSGMAHRRAPTPYLLAFYAWTKALGEKRWVEAARLKQRVDELKVGEVGYERER